METNTYDQMTEKVNPTQRIPRSKHEYERMMGERRDIHPDSTRYGKHATQRGQKGAFGGKYRRKL